LRSDTVTKPTPAMLEAMFTAPVGDDVFGEDPSVNKLEELAARMLGMEAAVFCPSGTMTNQIGINIHTRPFDEIICYKGAHIYKYEGGGLAGNSQLSLRLLEGDRGRLSPDDILQNVNNAADPHQPLTTLVALENTLVREAGAFYTMAQLAAVSGAARSKGLRMHLDGARLFNALTETGDDPADIGKHFDSVSICLSKGLGAPVGSLILCSREKAVMARRRRKSLGGGMRQAGFLAAAGIFALKNNIGRLKEDHHRARQLGTLISPQPWVAGMMPVDTNIIIFQLVPEVSPASFLEALGEHQVRAVQFGPDQVRMVTHLDFHDEHLQVVKDALGKLRF
ncbi:MAG: threonine aldolase family protein, partial [Bacteroidota bacterium]